VKTVNAVSLLEARSIGWITSLECDVQKNAKPRSRPQTRKSNVTDNPALQKSAIDLSGDSSGEVAGTEWKKLLVIASI
jgi:hypothetical protein